MSPATNVIVNGCRCCTEICRFVRGGNDILSAAHTDPGPTGSTAADRGTLVLGAECVTLGTKTSISLDKQLFFPFLFPVFSPDP